MTAGPRASTIAALRYTLLQLDAVETYERTGVMPGGALDLPPGVTLEAVAADLARLVITARSAFVGMDGTRVVLEAELEYVLAGGALDVTFQDLTAGMEAPDG